MLAFYFALTPLLIGLSAPFWFGTLLVPVRRLRQGARWLDEQRINPPATDLTVHTLREHEKCGDKLVVAHHLAGWSRDLQRKIAQHLLYGGASSLILVVVFTVVNEPSLRKSTASLRDLLSAVSIHLPMSIVLAASLIEILVVVKLISDQAAKYADVIEAAKPPQKPLLVQCSEFIGKIRR